MRVHTKVINYLGEIDVDSDELVDFSISDKEVLCKDSRVTTSIEDNRSSGINDANIVSLNSATREPSSPNPLEYVHPTPPLTSENESQNISTSFLSIKRGWGEEQSVSVVQTRFRHEETRGSRMKEQFIAIYL